MDRQGPKGHEEQDVLLYRYDQNWDASSASMEHTIMSPTTLMEKWNDAQDDYLKRYSHCGWVSRAIGKTAISLFLIIILENKPWKLDQRPFAATIPPPQPHVQPFHRQWRRKQEYIQRGNISVDSLKASSTELGRKNEEART